MYDRKGQPETLRSQQQQLHLDYQKSHNTSTNDTNIDYDGHGQRKWKTIPPKAEPMQS